MKVLHLFLSPIRNESRLEKEAEVIYKLGFTDIQVLGIWDSDRLDNYKYFKVIRYKSLYNKNKKSFFKYILILFSFWMILTNSCVLKKGALNLVTPGHVENFYQHSEKKVSITKESGLYSSELMN